MNNLKKLNCVHILLLSFILYEVAYLTFGWYGVLGIVSLAVPVFWAGWRNK